MRRLIIHSRIVVEPDVSIDTMLRRCNELFNPGDVSVEEGSRQTLQDPPLFEVRVHDGCPQGIITPEQALIHAFRNGMESGHVGVYFVRLTDPPMNGCAAYRGEPSVLIASYATEWTLSHDWGTFLDCIMSTILRI